MDRKGAGTDSDIMCVLHNDSGQSSGQFVLGKGLKADFEKGQTDDFEISATFLEQVDMIEIWRENDKSPLDEWFLEVIKVHCKESNRTYVFPFLRWIKENYHYKIHHLDTSLPQYDSHVDQRRMELDDKKMTYQMEVKVPGLPVQATEIPEDEKFSFSYQFDLVRLTTELVIKSKLITKTTGRFLTFQCQYKVSVTTMDRKGAGTDSDIMCVLHNDSGQSSGQFVLGKGLKADFEKGQTDDFEISATFLEQVDMIEIWRENDKSPLDEWFLEVIKVHCKESNRTYVFPFLRWIKENYHYKIHHLDTSLPQYDSHVDQRRMELDDKKMTYQMEVKVPGLPVQATEIPEDEKFSFSYQFDLVRLTTELVIKSKLITKTTGRWESLDDILNIYIEEVFTKPTPLKNGNWDTDEHFGFQRLGRLNNSVITLCTEIPSKLAVTDEMLEPFLAGNTVQDAIAQKNLFYVDMEILDGIPTRPGYKVCAPIALFYYNSDEASLVPIAIQLNQQPADDNPVFLPSDPPYTWMMAKMWYNNSDTCYHQAITHLGFTHLVMEGCVLATHRNLSHSHPIFKLLAPHFLYLVAINGFALTTLINPGGIIDDVMAPGIDGVFEVIRRKLAVWRMDVDGTLPVELEKRGVRDENVLIGYHFRDDAILLWEAIKNYVTKYVQLYYDNPETYTKDHEIQAWAQELVKSREDGGCGILGVPGDGSITNESDLVSILTSIIFTVSVGHAAANFAQYDEYGFPPNYPMTMEGVPPIDKTPLTEESVLKALPDKEASLGAMSITKILSGMGTNKLGDFEVRYVYDPKADGVVEEFRKELEELSNRVESLERFRKVSYPWLNPEIVPNSISI
ncbi:polyunsaturated fatty acid 5-lipoxygenase-like [Argopecten irradians]|uniref:polyunsaturated fatty acid 5-lipoxygenase-like n=1 Tax=Argopecten irradians TaxID=31199 RepID=UPI00371AA88C